MTRASSRRSLPRLVTGNPEGAMNFTEGLDTADLKEAKALLEKLTEPAIAAEG
jgi:hypothetical protein